MEINPTHLTVAQFCEGLDDGTITINRKYQRQPGVWPAEAQSFLIETILLGFPMPKLAIHLATDRLTKRTTSEIVDGQQRATAINSFLKDEFRLSKNVEIDDARTENYSSLTPELQQRFLSYSIGIDQLVNLTDEDIREIFRRINSYEVPLNPEEQRHAKHQGPFKWFIYRTAKEYGDALKTMGTLSERQLIRMADMKLLAEISHALINGISTTSKLSLNKLYKSRDVEFEEESEFSERLGEALDFIIELSEIHDTELTKHFSIYSLTLAIIHAKHNLPELQEVGEGGRGLADRGHVVRALSFLARSLDADDGTDDGMDGFRRAFEKGTNVKDQRVARAEFFLDAVSM